MAVVFGILANIFWVGQFGGNFCVDKDNQVKIAVCCVWRWLSMALQEPHGKEWESLGTTETINTVFNAISNT